jgi:TRIAD3 protein (E3 ubiquitin-protein ligase RNF216)
VLSGCEAAVLSCFPDICPDFLRTQAANHEWDPQRITTYLLDEQEEGRSYPKRAGLLKRKRPEKEEEKAQDEDDQQFIEGDPRLGSKDRAYVKVYTKAA